MKTNTVTPEPLHQKPAAVNDRELTMSANPLTPELLQKINAYWRAANYLSVGQIYLYDKPAAEGSAEAIAHQTPRGGALGHGAGTELHLCAPEPGHQEI